MEDKKCIGDILVEMALLRGALLSERDVLDQYQQDLDVSQARVFTQAYVVNRNVVGLWQEAYKVRTADFRALHHLTST